MLKTVLGPVLIALAAPLFVFAQVSYTLPASSGTPPSGTAQPSNPTITYTGTTSGSGASGNPASATGSGGPSVQSLNAILQTLLTQLAALQAKANTSGSQGSASAPAFCPVISRTLARGSTGADVTGLQQFLITEGFLSQGLATGYFGSLTQAAVQGWQSSQGIVSSGSPSATGWGVVGPHTRAALASCTPSQTSQTTLPQGTITSPLGTVSPNSPLIPGNSSGTGSSGGSGGGGGSSGGSGSSPSSPTPPPPSSPASCSFNGQTVTSGQSVTAYQSSSVLSGSSCISQVRTCSSGSLSGSYAYSSCSVTASPTPPPVATSTAPSITVLAPMTQSNMYFNDWTVSPIMNAEVTPWAVGTGALGGWHSFLVTTANTYFCSTPDNMFAISSLENIADENACHFKEGEALNASNAAQANTLPLWKRDYDGAFSAFVLQTGASNWTVYMINHGELENDDPTETPGLPYCVPAPDIGYGALPCTAADWWGSYNAFISMSSFPFTSAGLADNGSLTTDYGPIAWPSNGYIESLDGGNTWIKATDGGVRTPSAIITNGYMYVYYEDLSQGSDADGRGPGIKVIRAPVTSSGVDPNSFVAYYDGAWQDPALPPGYTLANYYTKFSVKGGRSSGLFPDEIQTAPPTPGTGRTDQRRVSDIISFSVAKVDGTDWYLGVANDESKGLTLMLSKDLVNWSDPTVVPGTAGYYTPGVDLQTAPFLYARLANANGDSDTDIDPTNFYIIGTQTASHGGTQAKVVDVIHLKLNL